MKTTHLLPLDAIPVQVCKQLHYFFMDIDDTFTTCGKITAGAFHALWQLHDAGVKVVPVTGRPAGWCDMIARFWPVEAVIGENGAFYYLYHSGNRKMVRRYFQSEPDRSRGKNLLETLRSRVLKEVPGCAISADQPFRTADLAIDYCEDVPELSRDSVGRICAIARALGLNCKVSSIHVNCWYGTYDKLSSVREFLFDQAGMSLVQMQSSIMFAGDSPNDEPLFSAVEHSTAVANIHDFLSQMTHYPKYVAQKCSGEGFHEIVAQILRKRTNRQE
jgi:HAD superfamily hydrolase (TIGR01484 family)